jgi:hypothetical protein
MYRDCSAETGENPIGRFQPCHRLRYPFLATGGREYQKGNPGFPIGKDASESSKIGVRIYLVVDPTPVGGPHTDLCFTRSPTDARFYLCLILT